jgi:hypothetical protein
VGSVVSVLGLLVVVVSAPTPIRTGLVATIDVFSGCSATSSASDGSGHNDLGVEGGALDLVVGLMAP